MNLLNSFKDQEILNAFKLALLHTNHNSLANEDTFYHEVGENFITSLRQSNEVINTELERKLSELNIQSESYESARISDFGDIIPVNFEFENDTFRKHQKWSIAEHKLLSNFLSGRNISEIIEDEWQDISNKLNRTYTSVLQKGKEIIGKTVYTNKRRKITEVPSIKTFNDSISSVSVNKIKDTPNTLTYSELEGQTELGRSQRSDIFNGSRKKTIEQVLKEFPNKRGTKNQIFDAISRRFNIDLHNKSTPQYKGFQQTLSKCYPNTKGFYAIRTSSSEYEVLNKRLRTLDDCKSWKEKTFLILNYFPEKQAKLEEIKHHIEAIMSQNYSKNSHEYVEDMNVWERNLLKIFSKHDNIFDTSNSKSIFYL
mmetsp:Transcript_30186/g.26737  ORF Transcript_30186/g.26737 Transcript_30186/m.26737 type:complete len:369 (-) Transcript_30186:140-1246(-)